MAVVGGARLVVLNVAANVAGYVASLGTAAAATRTFATTHAASMSTVGTAVAGFGALAVGALALSANEAIKWESAWAGVTKTVDGSTSQMAALEDELRSMAKTLPATHGEIAAVAEAAGQLGIKREDVAGFTKTMIDLGVSTNLTAEQAATSLARFSNIMGTSASDVDRLGSALVALGNDGASTEGEIVTMALRIAGAGRSIGLTEGEVLGFANTLSSLGIEAEAGGTAISTVMLKIQQATDSGGDALVGFARVAGLSAQDFKAKFEGDAAGAIQLFVEGLARADQAGENTTGVMSDLGFEGIRVTDTLRRLASNSDLLKDSLSLGNSAWEENAALVEEANKRYATTASQLAVARNNLRDTAITIGDNLLPAIQKAAEGFSDFTGFIGDLPAPLLTLLTNLTGVVGGLALLAGGLLIVVPQVAATVAAMKALAVAAPAAAAGVKALAIAGGIAAGVLILAAAVGAIADATSEAVPSIEDTKKALLDLQDTAELSSIDKLFADLDLKSQLSDGQEAITGLKDAVDSLDVNKAEEVGQAISGIFKETGNEKIEATLSGIGSTLGELVASGDADAAAAQFALMNEALGGTDESAARLMELMPAYAEALKAADNAARESAGSSEALALGVAGVTQTTAEAEEALTALSTALDALFTQAFSVEEATDAFATSLNALSAAAEENGTRLDGNTVAAIANREAMRSSVDAAFGVIDAMAKQGASADDLAAQTSVLRGQLYDQAVAAGYSKTEAERYASALDNIPAVAATTISLNSGTAEAALDRIFSKVTRLDGKVATTTVRTVNSVTNRVSTQTSRMEADGGFYPRSTRFYANGGENHVAQIAPAGSWRVWAEPETGGEAYIPLASSKRARSVAITQSVADRFGYDMVPRRNVQTMAAGGVLGGRGGQSQVVQAGPQRIEIPLTIDGDEVTRVVLDRVEAGYRQVSS